MEWQPIETSPKDGPDGSPMVLLLNLQHMDDYDASITIGFWSTLDSLGDDDTEGWCDWPAGMDDNCVWEEFHPTHWMPLPDPPKAIDTPA